MALNISKISLPNHHNPHARGPIHCVHSGFKKYFTCGSTMALALCVFLVSIWYSNSSITQILCVHGLHKTRIPKQIINECALKNSSKSQSIKSGCKKTGIRQLKELLTFRKGSGVAPHWRLIVTNSEYTRKHQFWMERCSVPQLQNQKLQTSRSWWIQILVNYQNLDPS